MKPTRAARRASPGSRTKRMVMSLKIAPIGPSRGAGHRALTAIVAISAVSGLLPPCLVGAADGVDLGTLEEARAPPRADDVPCPLGVRAGGQGSGTHARA